MPVVYFVLAIMALIVLHEAGHAWVAHRRGMRVTDFSLFFGPALWSRRIGGTLVAVRSIPLGGYIKVAGMGGAKGNLWRPVDEEVWGDTPADERSGGAIVEAADLAVSRGVARDVADDIAATAAQGHRNGADPASAWRTAAQMHLGDPGDPHGDAWTVLNGDQGRTFDDASPWSRFLVAVGGPAMNVAIAVVLLSFTNLWTYDVSWDGTVSGVAPGTAAEDVGLEAGDRLVAVDGVPLGRIGDIDSGDPGVVAPDDVATVAATLAQPQATDITVERDGQRFEVALPAGDRGPLGVGIDAQVDATWQPSSVTETFVGETSIPRQIGMMLGVIAALFSAEMWTGLFAAATSDAATPGSITSVIGAASMSNQALELAGALGFLQVAGAISLSLGVFNAVPIPPLDGWLMANAGLEGAVNRVRRLLGIDGRWQMPARAVNVATLSGLVVVLALMVLVIAADVSAMTT